MSPQHYHVALTDLHFTSTNMILVPYIPTNSADHISFFAVKQMVVIKTNKMRLKIISNVQEKKDHLPKPHYLQRVHYAISPSLDSCFKSFIHFLFHIPCHPTSFQNSIVHLVQMPSLHSQHRSCVSSLEFPLLGHLVGHHDQLASIISSNHYKGIYCPLSNEDGHWGHYFFKIKILKGTFSRWRLC